MKKLNSKQVLVGSKVNVLVSLSRNLITVEEGEIKMIHDDQIIVTLDLCTQPRKFIKKQGRWVDERNLLMLISKSEKKEFVITKKKINEKNYNVNDAFKEFIGLDIAS